MDADWLSKNLILIMGKGGVGKTWLARAAAHETAARGKRTLLAHVLQLEDESQQLVQTAPNLWEITLRPADCFREYIILKLRLKALYSAFLGNRVTQYLEKAAPGVREMVLLGKVWFETQNYDHVVVDMPSTGYALTIINTPFNFERLFPGGPVYHDAKEMVATMNDPEKTALVTVTLPEEMPIQESLELAASLKKLMPRNPSWLVLNRLVRLDPTAINLFKEKDSKLTAASREQPAWRALEYLVWREAKSRALLKRLEPEWKDYRYPWLEISEQNA